MRIEVLGAVRAWREDRELPLGPPQQRSLLAVLAVAGGQPVPVRDLVTALWEQRPPATAVNVVQTYVKRLRRVLDPDRPVRGPSLLLPRIATGYALRMEPDAVDLWRFRRLVRQARQAGPDDPPGQEFMLLQEALALWRGPPADDLPWLAQHRLVRAAVEEHGAAVGRFADTALTVAADAAEVVPVVAAAAAGRPYDEPLHARLIRLYHAAGRRAEAVRVYQHSRKWLQDELGFDPGPELAAAYRELLQDIPPAPAGAGGSPGSGSNTDGSGHRGSSRSSW